jgi:hypothetical protein
LDEANVQEFLDCYPGELAEEDTEQLTALSWPEDEDFGAILGRPQLTTYVFKERLQMANDIVNHFFDVNNIMAGAWNISTR